MRTTSPGRWAILLVAGVLASGAARAERTLDTLPRAEVRGTHILLRELVANHDTLPRGWGDRVVLPAPEPGKVESLSIASIAYALQQYPDMSDVTLRGTPSTAVRRAMQAVDPAQVVRLVETHVQTHAPWQGWAYQVFCDGPGKIENVPAGLLALAVASVEPVGQTGDRHLFRVTLAVDGTVVRTVAVQATVAPMREVWVATRSLERGRPLAEGDLMPRLMAATAGDGQPVPAGESVLGLELCREVRPGQPLLRQALLQPACARTGDQISVLAALGGLTVRMQAKALASGRRGDQIMALNETSKRRILVKLVNPKEAVIEVPASGAKE